MSKDPAEAAFWAERWQSGETRWDQGQAHPCLDELLSEARGASLLPDGARILEPGCGRAHTGAALARLGYEVTAFDVVDRAIQEARTLYADTPNLTLTTGDALHVQPAWRGRFDAIYDRAMMCALPPEKRRAYARACFDHLRPGGAFLSVVVSERREKPEAGPPFAVTEAALTAMLKPGFRRLFSVERPMGVEMGGNAAKELCSLWARRDAWREDVP